MSDCTHVRVPASRLARLRVVGVAGASLVLTALVAGCGGSGGNDTMHPAATGTSATPDRSGAFDSGVESPSPGTGPAGAGSGAFDTGIGGSGAGNKNRSMPGDRSSNGGSGTNE